MAQLTTDNINTIAAAVASMGDNDYLYIYKADGQAMGRITKAQLLQGINQSSGGMSAAIYQAIQTNVEVLRLNFNALSSALANLAFSGDNPNLSISEFNNWPEQESGGGGDTPTPTDEPTITFKDGSGNTIATLNVGEIADGESSVSNTFFVYGTNLTEDITLRVTNGRFDVLPTTIPMNNAASGVQVTITYSGNSSLATDYVVASSNGATSKTLVATATKDEGQQGGDEPTPSGDTVNVTYKLLNYNQPSGTTQDNNFGYYKKTINKGSRFSETLATSYTPNNDVRVYMGGTILQSSVNGNAITIDNVTDDIDIVATAATGVVKITASASTSVTINDTTYSLPAENDTLPEDIKSISSMSFANKNYITSCDFGGAAYSGVTNAISTPFYNVQNIESLKGLVIKTSYGATMNSAFKQCYKLSSIDTIGWECGNVTSFEQIFNGCNVLTNLDVSHLITSNVTNLVSAFASCKALVNLIGLNTWDVSGAASFYNLFYETSALSNIDISSWNTGTSLTSIRGMFNKSGVASLTIGNFNTGNLSSETSVALTLTISGSSLVIHCKSQQPPTLNATYNWLKGAPAGSSNVSYINSGQGAKTVSIKVPSGSLGAYQEATGWEDVESQISEE